MSQWILIGLVTGPLLWAGCGKPKAGGTPVATATNVAAPVVVEPWLLRMKELTAAVKPTMTEDEVLQIAGDPKMVRTAIGAESAATWQYELGDGNWFIVQFDKSNRVAHAELVNAVKPQN